MFGRIFFWMQDPYDPQVPLENWIRFLDFTGGVFVMILLVGALITWVGYSWYARRHKVHTWSDLFRPYTPINWLLLSAIQGLAMGVLCFYFYAAQLGSEVTGSFEAALETGLLTIIATAIVDYLTMLLPGATPLKFKYRPLWIFMRKRGIQG